MKGTIVSLLVGLAAAGRRTVNFGPAVPIRSAEASAWSDLGTGDADFINWEGLTGQGMINGYNARRAATAVASGASANGDFVRYLAPEKRFRLRDRYPSAGGVVHEHWVQVLAGLPIDNALLTVNLERETGRVISFSDSSFDIDVGDFWAGLPGADAVLEGRKNQLVLGQPAAEADTLADTPDEALARLLEVVLGADVDFDDALEWRTGADSDEGYATFVAEDSKGGEWGTRHTYIGNTRATATEGYLHDGRRLEPVWRFEVEMADNWYEASVRRRPSSTEDVLMVVDWVHDYMPTADRLGDESRGRMERRRLTKERAPAAAVMPVNPAVRGGETVGEAPTEGTYNVFAWGLNDPEEGKRTAETVVPNEEASPAGWHSIPSQGIAYRTTRGNNVHCQANPDGGNRWLENYRPIGRVAAGSGNTSVVFDFPLGWPAAGEDQDATEYLDAAIAQLFYTNNKLHDFFYRYGFNEESGNFQDYNFGRGGRENDAVQANAQDGSGMNNANFATPPDGRRPRMRMYVWSGTHPYRDGDFEAGIVTHEYAHGLSTRLTGGPANSGCLGWGEAGGMGEGWGDFLATMIRMKQAPTKGTTYTMGEWASGMADGIRPYRYSTDHKVNPYLYSTLNKPGYRAVHAIGAVWATALYEVAAELMNVHGFDSDLENPTVDEAGAPVRGNSLAVQIVILAMKMQPCRPSFLEARRAIILAEKVVSGGRNRCSVWRAFARRGLGVDAAIKDENPWGGGVRTDGFKVPKKCRV